MKCQDTFSRASVSEEDNSVFLDTHVQQTVHENLGNEVSRYFFNSLNFHDCKYNSSYDTFSV